MSFAWRIEVVGAQRYRFVNVSGERADRILIAALGESGQPGELSADDTIEVAGHIDHLLGSDPYVFDQDLADGQYRLQWHTDGADPEERHAVRLSVPLPSPQKTAHLNDVETIEGNGFRDIRRC